MGDGAVAGGYDRGVFARNALARSRRRPLVTILLRGAAIALVALAAARAGAEPTPAADAIGLPAAAPGAPHHGSPSRPDYDCSRGGFCGSEGWEYGSYATDTKESMGCGPDSAGVDLWDLSSMHAPTLPAFARQYCTFFYGFASCWVPTVICEN